MIFPFLSETDNFGWMPFSWFPGIPFVPLWVWLKATSCTSLGLAGAILFLIALALFITFLKSLLWFQVIDLFKFELIWVFQLVWCLAAFTQVYAKNSKQAAANDKQIPKAKNTNTPPIAFKPKEFCFISSLGQSLPLHHFSLSLSSSPFWFIFKIDIESLSRKFGSFFKMFWVFPTAMP